MLLKNKRVNILNSIIATLLVAIMLLFYSCSKKAEETRVLVVRDSLPAMFTKDVNTLVSDSGIIRYKIIAKEWMIFDKKSPSYWSFEKGVYLEKFDTLLHVEASIEADTAYFFDKKKLWELKGNIHIKNQKEETFDTEQLFWDQNTKRVYSKKFIRIQQIDKVITGYGFESNEQFTNYEIRNSGGIFPFDTSSNDSIRTDSIQKDSLN
ncbi:MAG: LPS export ABC transporter periplasmic protein LptC [Bacteroidaceae bacterium]|nr:LPS export ABC transporter periplasmic protein LptC [Bacteroidaceae bacterium]